MGHVINGTTRWQNIETGVMAVTVNGTLRADNVQSNVVTIDGTLIADNLSCGIMILSAGIGNSIFANNLSTSDLTLNGGGGFQDIVIEGLRTGPNNLIINGAFVEFVIEGMVLGQKNSSPTGALLDVSDLEGFTIRGTIYRSAGHGAIFDACSDGFADLHIIDPSAGNDNAFDGISVTGLSDSLTLRGAVRGATLQAANPRYGVDVAALATNIDIDMVLTGWQTAAINNAAAGEEVLTGKELQQAIRKVGDIVVETGAGRLGFRRGGKLLGVIVHIDTAPTGSAAIFDLLLNGTSVFSADIARPTIAAGAFLSAFTVPDTTTNIEPTDYAQMKVIQIGSTIAGADAVMTLFWAA